MAVLVLLAGAARARLTHPDDGDVRDGGRHLSERPAAAVRTLFGRERDPRCEHAHARDGGGVHSRIQPCWLTGQHAKRTEGPDVIVDLGRTEARLPKREQSRLETYNLGDRLRVVTHPQNRGYGSALRSGFKAARKELVFYTDGDGQYDPCELSLLLPKKKQQAALLFQTQQKKNRNAEKSWQ
mgnify:CR=1 FL=1